MALCLIQVNWTVCRRILCIKNPKHFFLYFTDVLSAASPNIQLKASSRNPSLPVADLVKLYNDIENAVSENS